jgi:hypothetical protein
VAKKKTALRDTLFQNINPYGEENETSNPAGGALLIPIAHILPDPNQPRRLLPDELAQQVAQGELTTVEAMQAWLTMEGEQPSHTLRQLQTLASSIAQHGLINPITVRSAGTEPDLTLPPHVQYLVVTGERRYWAHVLLVVEQKQIQIGESTQDPQTIQANQVAPGVSIRAHQLLENILREDINAVEKARGLWALRYELSGVNHGSPTATDKDLVTWVQVQEALGFSKRYRIFVTSVLELNPTAQMLIEQHNLSERMVRPIVQRLKGQPELQLAALQQIVAWQHDNENDEDVEGHSITKTVEVLVDRILNKVNRGTTVSANEMVQETAGTLQYIARLKKQARNVIKSMGQLDEQNRGLVAQELVGDPSHKYTVQDLQILQRQLTALLEDVQRYQDLAR